MPPILSPSRRRLLFGASAEMPRLAGRPVPQRFEGDTSLGPLAAIATERCLNAQGVVCASCADACPHRAIRIPLQQRGALHVITELCDGCGDCVPVCPADAITLYQPTLESA